MSVEDYVQSKVRPEHREAVGMLRALVRECAPESQEMVSYGMPVFKARNIFAWIIGTKQDVTFGFTRGVSFDDRFGKLRGVGKHARHIKIRGVDDVDRDVLRYYIRQAVKLDQK
jgi:hypothetical protein